MHRKTNFSIIVCLLVPSLSTSAFSLGIGAYIEAAGGESYRKVKSRSLEDTSGTLKNYGFKAGLIFDTYQQA